MLSDLSIWSILVAILILGVVVTIHEMGHYWVACLLKIKVYEVSFFVGPKLFSWKRKGVDYSVRALPFGAYVRFNDFDENGNMLDTDDPSFLLNQKRWKRLLVALAGPFMNYFLGVVIFMGLFMAGGYYSLYAVPGSGYAGSQLEAVVQEDPNFHYLDKIEKINGKKVITAFDFIYEIDSGVPATEPATVTLISAETGEEYDIVLEPDVDHNILIGISHLDYVDPKYNGWQIVEVYEGHNDGDPVLKIGDYLTAVDGKSVADEDFDQFFSNHQDGDKVTLTYIRNGHELEDDCTVHMMTTTNPRGLGSYLGVPIDSAERFFEALETSVKIPVSLVKVAYKMIGDVFEGHEKVYNMVQGPVGMTVSVSEVVDNVDSSFIDKVYNMVLMAGLITIAVTITNMLPIPGLDGIQVVYILYEMITGRPLSEKAENVLLVVGFILILGLAAFALVSDVLRIVFEYI
ncbi:MAG: RIP metalloprotease RseP [Clostridiales bacterium]|nr:RIP metalloprotease RseP [Clostridiales bacterium]